MFVEPFRLVTISHASGTLTFPADFILIGAMNPCPCGYASDPRKECRCAPSAITRYQKRLSETSGDLARDGAMT